jgi:hypothetical protein
MQAACGLNAHRDGGHFFGRRHLQIDRQGEASRIASRSPSRICRRSSRRWIVKPSAPGGIRHRRGPRRIGMRAAAGVPDGGHVIDVQTQAQRFRHQASPRLPGLIAGMRSSSSGS